MSKNNSKTNSTEKMTTLDGLMTISKFEDGLHCAEFMCCEDVKMKPFAGDFKVQGMWNGNIYMTEKKKRKRNRHPIFRVDNSTFSLGKDGKYYFSFSMPEELIDELPEELLRQASTIAKRIILELL